MTEDSPENGASTARRPAVDKPLDESRWLVWLGTLLAAVCLVWVFHDVDLRRLARDAANVRWPWVGFAIAFDVLGYVCQGLRWWFLLPPGRRPSVARTTQAVYAGLFTNELLPVRPGELVRAYLVSRWSGVAFARVLSSILVERLLDGLWLALGIALVASLVPLPGYLLKAEEILVILVAIGATAWLTMMWRSRRRPLAGGDVPAATTPEAPPSQAPSPVPRGWRSMLDHLAAHSTPGDLAMAFAVSSLVTFFEAVALWGVMRAYGIPLALGAGIAVLLIVRLGTALPSAPGNLGTYQFLCVVGVSLFGVDKTTATGFSVAAFVLLTGPLLAIGFVALRRSGMTLASLRRELETRLAHRAVA